MHVSALHSDLPSLSRLRADTGHTPTHAPQPMQASLSTTTAIMFSSSYTGIIAPTFLVFNKLVKHNYVIFHTEKGTRQNSEFPYCYA